MPLERLQKILSRAGVASRRAAETLIAGGRVTVNGQIVRTLGSKADLDCDAICVDGTRVRTPGRLVYLLLNKPRGVITSRSDPRHRPTVLDLVGARDYLYPVGRLDYNSEGLLILTNDGELAERLMHPRTRCPKTYEVKVRGVPDAAAIARLRRGVLLEGRPARPADLILLAGPSTSAGPQLRPRARLEAGGSRSAGRRGGKHAWLRVTLLEGRNREIRRMFEAVGHPVVKLRRTRLAFLSDARLPPGAFRPLTPAEVARLKREC